LGELRLDSLEEDGEDVEAVLEMASARRGVAGSSGAMERKVQRCTRVFSLVVLRVKRKEKPEGNWRR
jgi:hypothetical protein